MIRRIIHSHEAMPLVPYSPSSAILSGNLSVEERGFFKYKNLSFRIHYYLSPFPSPHILEQLPRHRKQHTLFVMAQVDVQTLPALDLVFSKDKPSVSEQDQNTYVPPENPYYPPTPVEDDPTIRHHSSDPVVPSPVGDPHVLPEFTDTSLTHPSAPVLYLPPLLSSLPNGYNHSQLTLSNNRPLATETRLPSIDPASLALHKALHQFRPITTEYAETAYGDAFNWADLVMPEESEREWYCVVFRSKRKEGSDGGRK